MGSVGCPPFLSQGFVMKTVHDRGSPSFSLLRARFKKAVHNLRARQLCGSAAGPIDVRYIKDVCRDFLRVLLMPVPHCGSASAREASDRKMFFSIGEADIT